MARRRRTSRQAVRLPAIGGRRIAIAVCCVALGLASGADSLARVVGQVDPIAASRLAFENGEITAKAALTEFRIAPSGASGATSAVLARKALRQNPTVVDALTVLGFQAFLAGDVGRGKAVLDYSDRLSRRELQTRIWAIEDAVSRGDITGALESYDLALRTSDNAKDLLYPRLAEALDEERVRAKIIDLLAERPEWARSFVYFAASQGGKPAAVMTMFEESAGRGLPIRPLDYAIISNHLWNAGENDRAWRAYRKIAAAASRTTSRDPTFRQQPEVTAPFDWNLVNNGEIASEILRGDNGNGIAFFTAVAGVGGDALWQGQMLPPGRYRLEGRASGLDVNARSTPFWTLTCTDGRELGRVELSAATDAPRAFSATMTVPQNCPAQRLTLVLRPSDRRGGVQGQIETAQLRPTDMASEEDAQ